MTPEERTALVAQYKNGTQLVTQALQDIKPAELDFKPSPKEWSCREIVHHLADAETISGYRLRRLLTELNPYIHGFDQDVYATRLQYAKRAIEPSLEALRSAVETTLQIIETMTEADWKRTGEHSDTGPYSAEQWLKGRSTHISGHAGQIQRTRAKYKK